MITFKRTCLLVATSVLAMQIAIAQSTKQELNGWPASDLGAVDSVLIEDAIAIIDCFYDAHPPAPGEPNPADEARDLLDSGKFKDLDITNPNKLPPDGTHEGGDIGVRTKDVVGGKVIPRDPISIASTIFHELDHERNRPPGEDHDARTDPDQQPAGTDLEKKGSALVGHSRVHLNTLVWLCDLRGMPFPNPCLPGATGDIVGELIHSQARKAGKLAAKAGLCSGLPLPAVYPEYLAAVEWLSLDDPCK